MALIVDNLPTPDDADLNISLPCEERPSDSPLIDRIWRSTSSYSGNFISTAASHWEIVVTKDKNRTTLTLRGPETKATSAFCPPDSESFGIVFKAGAFMPNFPVSMLMDRQDLNLPLASGRSFWLNSSAWQFPDFENAETFVDHLVRDGLLIVDPLVEGALREQPHTVSLRTIQRRFLQATGLTHNTFYQIQRAHNAAALLKQGMSILDVVDNMGYSDQSHLTRVLKLLMGHTPAQIVNKNLAVPMSFLFKTPLF